MHSWTACMCSPFFHGLQEAVVQSVRNLEPADADVCDLYGLTRKATQAVKTGIAKLVSSTNATHILSARLSKSYTKSYNTDVKKFLNYLKYEGHCYFEKAYSENDAAEGEPEPLFATVDEDCFSVDEVLKMYAAVNSSQAVKQRLLRMVVWITADDCYGALALFCSTDTAKYPIFGFSRASEAQTKYGVAMHGRLLSFKSHAGALWRDLDITDRWSPIPTSLGGRGTGIGFLSRPCDKLMQAKSLLDHKEGRVREKTPSVTFLDMSNIERTVLNFCIPTLQQMVDELQKLQLLSAAASVSGRKVLSIASKYASQLAFPMSAIFTTNATRQMGGRGEASVVTFSELFATADGVQLQPHSTKRRQDGVCAAACIWQMGSGGNGACGSVVNRSPCA